MKTIAWLTVLVTTLVALGAVASKTRLFEFDEAGFAFEWAEGAKPTSREAGADIVIEGSHLGIALKVVVRKGMRIPEAQHQFRLMSYFPGQWQQTPDDCRGSGWEKCASWSWTAERTSDTGLGMMGFGPGGTYVVVLSCKAADFERLRPAMRQIQSGLRLR